MVDSEIIEDKEQIKGEILDFYQQLYTESEQWRPTASLDDLERISEEDKA